MGTTNDADIVISGLTADEVAERVRVGATNAVKARTSRSLGSIARENIFTLFNGILIGAMLIVLIFGHFQDAVFGGVMILNALIGIVSEWRAKRTLDALAIVDAPTAAVRRDGERMTIGTDEVVRDDVLELALGAQICVDGEILECAGLEVDEALLTGESRPVKKAVGDSVLAGTSVVAGSAVIVAKGVGADSYAQDLARRARVFVRTRSQIQEAINTVLQVISALLIPVVILTFWSQTRAATGNASWQAALILAVAAVVGMIPQGLVLLTSMNFAIGSALLARRGVLIQELPAVEVLARVDSLCVDKTGTLTTGRIRVREVVLGPGIDEEAVAGALAGLCVDRTNATAEAICEHFSITGAPTAPSSWSVPFSSARKWSAYGAGEDSWVLGAPEIVGPDASTSPLAEKVALIAGTGARVVALVRVAEAVVDEVLPTHREFVALVILEEDLRDDAEHTLDYFREQGVHVRVISGDNPMTVGALAAQVGLTAPDGTAPRLCDARTLPEDALSDAFQTMIEEHDVFGRVTPEQKRAMVEALQANGHCVAMTGDGVNDALALKDADLGIAMGNGAQATKAVAQVVLMDSKFSVLPGVVAEGRRIIANMERVSALFLAKTAYAALLVVVCAIAAWQYPFLPRHFTYIDALTIGIPAFFLALAPNSRRYVPGFLHRTLALSLPSGALLAAGALSAYRMIGVGTPQGRTAAVLSLMIGALWLLSITARPLRGWRIGLLVVMAVGAVLGVFIAFTRHFFALEWPSTQGWVVIVLVGLIVGVGIEVSHRLYHARIHENAQRQGTRVE